MNFLRYSHKILQRCDLIQSNSEMNPKGQHQHVCTNAWLSDNPLYSHSKNPNA